MRQKTYSFVVSLVLAGVIAYPANAGITLRAGRPPEARPIQVASYLSDINEALRRALLIHNLMNEMPMLRDTARTSESLKEQGKLMTDMQKHITDCNVKKFGKVFKNPKEVWGKMTSTYEKQRQDYKTEAKKQDQLTMSLKERQEADRMGWSISRNILMDVYDRPEKWGEVNKGASFPLWQDQIALFEKQWNQFYEELNAAYGVPLNGRPAIDEETRHNPQKYDQVLAAHKAYVADISRGQRSIKAKIAKENPPKAPKGLPRWQDIVRVDPTTGQAIPELPEPWKKMSENKFKDYIAGGEMSQFFDGKTLTPTAAATTNVQSDLEMEYDMMLVVDSLEKGAGGTAGAHQKMVQPFVEQIAQLGIDTKDFDIVNRSHYARVFKELKDMKKTAVDNAYKYVEQLEKQDQNNPKLVAQRAKVQAEKQARLSAEAQSAIAGLDNVIQISQMSPSAQQRLVLSALEKDENASVHLTQTNAVNIDQLMREQKSTNKIIAESYQQVNSAVEQQRNLMPQMAECHF